MPLFRLFLVLTLALFAVFNLLDQPVRTPAAPGGIVSFELARTPEAASAMLASWGESARLSLAFGLGLDFLFMPVYATALSLSILIAADRRRGGVWSALGKALAWGAFLATGFDAVENISFFTSCKTALFHLPRKSRSGAPRQSSPCWRWGYPTPWQAGWLFRQS